MLAVEVWEEEEYQWTEIEELEKTGFASRSI
jgi:hypothetical protein